MVEADLEPLDDGLVDGLPRIAVRHVALQPRVLQRVARRRPLPRVPARASMKWRYCRSFESHLRSPVQRLAHVFLQLGLFCSASLMSKLPLLLPATHAGQLRTDALPVTFTLTFNTLGLGPD